MARREQDELRSDDVNWMRARVLATEPVLKTSWVPPVLTVLVLLACGAWVNRATAAGDVKVAVEAEEAVYAFQPADNGAGPMWCFGSTCLARTGDRVFASGIETVAGKKPLNNCRWLLYERGASGWKLLKKDDAGLTREPCPLAVFPGGPVFLSVNPTLAPGAYSGPARPEVLEFEPADPTGACKALLPAWGGKPPFTEHSYRSFAADGPARELVLFQNIDYTHAEWSFRDSNGVWSAQGQLRWPRDASHPKPGPIRVCYPSVALKNRAVFFCGVSDIIEPNPEWRAFKKQLTGKEWDYDFRRLFFTWTPDLTREPFKEWVEVASREKTCGWITPQDLWAGPDGLVHVLWTERALDERLRERFFPGERQSHALHHALVKDGKVVSKSTLMEAREGERAEMASAARFHVTPDGRLWVFCHVSGGSANVSENRLIAIGPDGRPGTAIKVPLKKPFLSFFTANVRGGSAPSPYLDLLGQRAGERDTIAYARVRIDPR